VIRVDRKARHCDVWESGEEIACRQHGLPALQVPPSPSPRSAAASPNARRSTIDQAPGKSE
jgi:hypothetical protein